MSDGDYSPGLEGVIAARTAISYLDVAHEEIVIRGYDLIDLARHVAYLDVGYLLLNGSLPDGAARERLEADLRAQQELPEAIWDVLHLLSGSGHLMDYQRTGISALGTFDPDLDDRSEGAMYERVVRLWAQIPVITAGSFHIKEGRTPVEPTPDLGYSANFLRMITGRRPSPVEAQTFDRLLTLYSEHEMPNSTFAARVIASTLSDLYGALTGAVASLKGSLHGGANEAVMHMLLEAREGDGMGALVRRRLEAKERIMGFGHRVYMRKMDPRAAMVKDLLRELVAEKGGGDLLDMCVEGEEVMREAKGLYPNLDYYAAPVFYLLDVPIQLYTPIFFCARMIGLGAHVMEQYGNNRLFRPRVSYTGPRGFRAGASEGSGAS